MYHAPPHMILYLLCCGILQHTAVCCSNKKAALS